MSKFYLYDRMNKNGAGFFDTDREACEAARKIEGSSVCGGRFLITPFADFLDVFDSWACAGFGYWNADCEGVTLDRGDEVERFDYYEDAAEICLNDLLNDDILTEVERI